MLFYILIAFVGMEYFRPESYFPVLKVSAIIPFCLFFLSLFYNTHVTNYQVAKLRNSILLMIFLILIIISVLTAEVTLYAFYFFKAIFGYFIFAGYYIDESEAVKALESQGYSNITVVEKQWLASGIRGCAAEDAAKFKVVATNPAGQRVDNVYVCIGYLQKGATIRSK